MIYVDNKNSNNGYEIVIISYDHLIFIDQEMGKTLTIYNNQVKKTETYKKWKTLLDEGFKVPELLDEGKISTGYALSQKYVSKIEYDHEQGLKSIINFYLTKTITNLNFASTSVFENLKSYLRSNNNKLLLSQLKKYIDENRLPLIECHGDCNYFNYLFDGNIYSFIDYERSGMHFFFSDILYYVFWDYYVLNNYSLLTNYINGKYDSFLSSLFKRFECNYECEVICNVKCNTWR